MFKQNYILYFILIAAAVIALFLYNPWLLYFQNDDLIHIPLSRDGVLLQRNSFRPICDISMMLDYKLWGKQAWGYHLTNLIIHIINSVLVFITVKLFVKKYLPAIEINLTAFSTAILFWIYMNHSESVFWILGRSAMLGMLFFLPAVFFYFNRMSGFNFLLCIFFCLIAWLSYESTIILLVLFFSISVSDIKRRNSTWKTEKKYLIIPTVAFMVYCCCRFYFMGTATNYYNAGSNQNISLSFFIGSLSRLVIRSWLPPSQNEMVLVIVFVLLIFLIVILTMKSHKKNLKITIAVLLILWMISLLPYIALSMDTKGVESERFIYLPSLFVCVIISLLILQLPVIWRTTSLIVIVFINTIVLIHHTKQYRFAGSIVNTTIRTINTLKNKNHLYAEGVPQENFGALIFSSGFVEGINWLKNEETVDSVIVLSQAGHDLPLQKNYPVEYSNELSLIKNLAIRKQFAANDVYFLYTDASLKIITSK